MSAFAVDPSHIDVILSVAINGPADRGPARAWHAPWAEELVGHPSKLTRELADRAGVAMLRENIASVEHLYADSELEALPGPAPTPDPGWYEWTNLGPILSIVEALKAISCLEYQSCEHGGWTGSGSAIFCNRLRATLVEYLPGYEPAPWTWDAEAALARAPRRLSPEQFR